MSTRLAGKVAIVTGSTSGIGRASAELFAREGARVVVNGRRRALGQAVVEGIKADGGEATYCYADMTQGEQIRGLIQQAIDSYGRLDIMMNNAWSGTHGTILEVTEEQWDAGINIILKAAFLGCKYAIPEMLKVGGGSIINVSSVHGVLAARRYLPYEAGKAGLINLTRQIAVDFGRQGIRANCICPGWIIVERSEEWVRQHPERRRRAEATYPLGRPGRPDEVARAALFLASEASSFVTGHALMVDGGLTAQLPETVAETTLAYFCPEALTSGVPLPPAKRED